jgi:integrase
LYVRCRAASKSYLVQRKVRGKVVKEYLGEQPVKQARQQAMRIWHSLQPKPAGPKVRTFEDALEGYLEDRNLAPKTRQIYRASFNRCLVSWKKRSLHDIGNDRPAVRQLKRDITAKHGRATWNQVMQILSAVYRWQRKADPTLPEPPTVAVEQHRIPPRDWAMSPEELQAWWEFREKKGKTAPVKGVNTLSAVKKAWWLTALFTGARKASIEALKWSDVDLKKKVIRFRVTKGDRPYTVPMGDKLAEILTSYRDSGTVPPSNWVFPSSKIDGHIVGVRDDKRGILSPHHLRHTFRTVVAELGATPDQARLLMGHSLGGDVSRGYITPALLIESLRPVANAVAGRYVEILGLEAVDW